MNLFIFPSEPYLENVTCYDSMQAFFVWKQVRNNLNFEYIVLDYPIKRSKIRIPKEEVERQLATKNIKLENIDNIIMTKVNGLKLLEKGLAREMLNKIKGKMYKFEDTANRIYENDRLITVGHFGKLKNPRYLNAGFAIGDVYYKTDTDDDILRIHVDHNYPKVLEFYDIIKKKLHKLSKKHTIEVWYHDRPCNIDDIGHFRFNKIPIQSLAHVYSMMDFAFVTHRESLGHYAFEMAKTGVPVILPDNVCLLPEIKKNLITTHISNMEQLFIKTNYDRVVSQNKQKMLEYTFYNFLKNIFNTF